MGRYVALLVVGVALVATPATVWAQNDGGGGPEQLWRAYPLDPSPSPATTPAESAAPAATVAPPDSGRPNVRAGEGGIGSDVMIVLLAGCLALGGLAGWTAHRSRN